MHTLDYYSANEKQSTIDIYNFGDSLQNYDEEKNPSSKVDTL